MLAEVSISFPNLGIEINDLPKTFTVFGFKIAYYGLIIGICMILAVILCLREAKKTKQKPDDYIDIAMVSIIAAIFGARIYYVIFEWDRYKDNLLSIFNIRQGGLAIYGGLIGGILAGYIVTKVKKLNFWQCADVASLGILVGQIVGRWGNFFNREAFGGDSDGLFAMRINCKDGIARVRVPEGVSYIDDAHKWIQVQPTFLYESTLNLILLILIMIFKKKKKYHGEMILWYTAGYGLIRFYVEGMRTDQLIIGNTGIPASQLLSAILAIVSIIVLIANRVMIAKKQKTLFKFFKLVEEMKTDETNTDETNTDETSEITETAKTDLENVIAETQSTKSDETQ